MMRWVITLALACGLMTGLARADGLRCIAHHYQGTLATSADGVREIEVVGDLAYLADRSGGLVIADVSDPASPVTLSSLPEVGFALDVGVDGNTVYVGTAGGGMAVVDVSDRSYRSVPPALITEAFVRWMEWL